MTLPTTDASSGDSTRGSPDERSREKEEVDGERGRSYSSRDEKVARGAELPSLVRGERCNGDPYLE